MVEAEDAPQEEQQQATSRFPIQFSASRVAQAIHSFTTRGGRASASSLPPATAAQQYAQLLQHRPRDGIFGDNADLTAWVVEGQVQGRLQQQGSGLLGPLDRPASGSLLSPLSAPISFVPREAVFTRPNLIREHAVEHPDADQERQQALFRASAELHEQAFQEEASRQQVADLLRLDLDQVRQPMQWAGRHQEREALGAQQPAWEQEHQRRYGSLTADEALDVELRRHQEAQAMAPTFAHHAPPMGHGGGGSSSSSAPAIPWGLGGVPVVAPAVASRRYSTKQPPRGVVVAPEAKAEAKAEPKRRIVRKGAHPGGSGYPPA